MSKKKKEPEIVPYKVNSYEEADRMLLDLGMFGSQIAGMEAEMNRRIQAIQKEYAENEKLRFAKDESAKIFAGIQQFCEKRKNDFKKRRTRDLASGRIGYRLNKLKVVNLQSGMKAEEIIKKLKRGLSKYVRRKEEINRDLILNDYKDKDVKLTDDMLAKAGLRIERDETFFCESNWQELNNADNAA